jgi:hypothetical protein
VWLCVALWPSAGKEIMCVICRPSLSKSSVCNYLWSFPICFLWRRDSEDPKDDEATREKEATLDNCMNQNSVTLFSLTCMWLDVIKKEKFKSQIYWGCYSYWPILTNTLHVRLKLLVISISKPRAMYLVWAFCYDIQ